MTVICYETQAGGPAFTAFPGTAEAAMERFRAQNPGAVVRYQFRAEDNLSGFTEDDRALFAAQCGRHGLSPDDLGREIFFQDGTRGFIRGIQPGRRKYNVRVWNCDRQAITLVSDRYAQQMAAASRANTERS